MPILEVGSRAPEFELATSQGQMATISQLLGEKEYLILAFSRRPVPAYVVQSWPCWTNSGMNSKTWARSW